MRSEGQDIESRLEAEWHMGGFFDKLRNGNYEDNKARAIVDALRSLDFEDDVSIPRRVVQLLWYLPSFLSWQAERVAECGGDVDAYKLFCTEVQNCLEEKLGIP